MLNVELWMANATKVLVSALEKIQGDTLPIPKPWGYA